LLGVLPAVAALLAGCSGTGGPPPLGSGGNGGRTCALAPQVGTPVRMGLFELVNHGTDPVTVRSVSLPAAHGMAMTEAWLVPRDGGPNLGVGFPYPPVTSPLWAYRVPASGAVIEPGEDLNLVFGLLRTTAGDGSSDGPMIVYAAGRTAYTLREKLSLALARTKCTLVGFGPPVNA
jgi:hypothetical protein